eukprot:1207216-Rhodomonas_salina.1
MRRRFHGVRGRLEVDDIGPPCLPLRPQCCCLWKQCCCLWKQCCCLWKHTAFCGCKAAVFGGAMLQVM